jgi:hypothetical protein
MIMVDNATTHTKKEYTISDFSMKSGTKVQLKQYIGKKRYFTNVSFQLVL